MGKEAAYCMFVCCFILFIIAIGLLGGSVVVLDNLNYGLQVSAISNKITTDQVHEPGRYFAGLGQYFLEFPKWTQILIFSDSIQAEKLTKPGAGFQESAAFYPTIKARSKEGLPISIDCVVLFRLGIKNDKTLPSLSEQLNHIYVQFGTNWNEIAQRVVNFEMRNVASTYTAFEFFENRTDVGISLRDALEAALKEYYFNIEGVSITNLAYPAAFETSIENTEIVKQLVEQYNFTKDATQIQADTNIQVALKDANITIEQALADARVIYVTKSGTANATSYVVGQQKAAFQGLYDNLKFDNTTGGLTAAKKLLTYYWIFLQRYHDVGASKLAIGKIGDLTAGL